MKKYNFGAGPCILPREVIEKTANAILDFNGIGLSIAEISHRSKDFQPVMDEAMALVKEVLNVPEGYSVLFLGGGASLEFCMIPFNFLVKKAGYLNTGVWAKKAMKEAKLFGDVVEVASSADENYTYLPKNFDVPTDLDYLHITTNNTIYGTEYHKDLDVPVRLIGDMSSDIFSRPVDVSKYDCIYGGAQKNLSMAGVTFIIIKDDVLGRVQREIPTMLDYRTHIKKGSMFNTPPVVPIYTALENLRWIMANGGVEAMEKLAKERAIIASASFTASSNSAVLAYFSSRTTSCPAPFNSFVIPCTAAGANGFSVAIKTFIALMFRLIKSKDNYLDLANEILTLAKSNDYAA